MPKHVYSKNSNKNKINKKTFVKNMIFNLIQFKTGWSDANWSGKYPKEWSIFTQDNIEKDEK